MKLYGTKRSPYARKVRVVALEKGLHLDLVDEDLANKSRALLDANPLGKVPTLVVQDGLVFYDSVVIVQYLDGLNDSPVLIPKSGPARWDVLKWEALADDMVTTAIGVYMEKVRHPQNFDPKFVNAGERAIEAAYARIAASLLEFQKLSLAPIAVAAAIGYIHFRLPHIAAKGDLARWFSDFSSRPSMAATMPSV